MTEIRKTGGPAPTGPIAGKPVAAPDAAATRPSADALAIAKEAPPTDVKRALKVIAGLALPPQPRIMWRDKTRDAWVREAAPTLVQAKKVLDMLREAALDPRTPVAPADWAAAQAKVQALGAQLAAADKHGVRLEAFDAWLAPHRDALRDAALYPDGPADPKAREQWKADGEAVLARARAADQAMDELRADTGVDAEVSRLIDGTVVGTGGVNGRVLDKLEARLNAPPPSKVDGFFDVVKGVIAIAGAVEIAPNGQLRERRPPR